jgi:hypothetical protein
MIRNTGAGHLGNYRFIDFSCGLGGDGWKYKQEESLPEETIRILNEEFSHFLLHVMFNRKYSARLDVLTHSKVLTL